MHNLQRIAERQKDILADLERQVKEIENSDLFKKNESLEAELKKLKSEHDALLSENSGIKERNTQLTNALYEYTFNEKVRVLDAYEEKLKALFDRPYDNAWQQLNILERNINARVNALKMELQAHHVETFNPIFQRLEDFKVEADAALREAREKIMKEKATNIDEKDLINKLRNEEITQDQVTSLTKTNNLERLIGLNIINALGILLIIVGTIAAARFVQVRMTDFMRMIAIFAGGAALLVIGEVLNRRGLGLKKREGYKEDHEDEGTIANLWRRATVFSLGLSAAGVAVLYVALTFGYFAWGILSIFVALGICIAITALVFLLSTYYRSQILLIMAFVGGYLPIFALLGLTGSRGVESVFNLMQLEFTRVYLYGAMIYFLTLSLLDLIVSFKMKWTISAYLGLFFSMASTGAVVSFFTSAPSSYTEMLLPQLILLGFVFLAFANYTVIPIVSTYFAKVRFTEIDIFMIGINTIASCIAMYGLFEMFGWRENFAGLLAVIFAITYIGLGLIIRNKFKFQETALSSLFYITGTTFVILVIPMQFGMNALTLGWMTQGVLLTVYGVLKNNEWFKNVGIVASLLSVLAFGLVTTYLVTNPNTYITWQRFTFEHTALTIGSLLVLVAYLYKDKELHTSWLPNYKNIVLVNVWILSMHLVIRLNYILPSTIGTFNTTYLMSSLAVVITVGYGFILPKIKILTDYVIRLISTLFYVLGIIWLYVNSYFDPVIYGRISTIPNNLLLWLVSTFLFVIFSVLSIYILYDMLLRFVVYLKMNIAYVPLFTTIHALILLTQHLLVQHGVSFRSMWFSFVYIGISLGIIIVGFARRHMYLRHFGLVLALTAVAKVFLLDLRGLTQSQRIVSYFFLGIILVAISFVYQLFSRRLDNIFPKE